MKVSTSTMHFREERASQLEQMAVLISTCVGGINVNPIYNASSQLRNENQVLLLKDGTTNPNIWGYDIKDFIIPLDTLKHIQPNTIDRGEVVLNLKIRAHVDTWGDMNDPFLELNFNVGIRGIGPVSLHHSGFHIDKHILSSAEPHPVYHIQYNINPNNTPDFNYGSTMHLDTPRLLHFPLDFILGVGFLTSNFFPAAFDELCNQRGFIKLNNTYQEKILKPYFHTLANHWVPFQQADVTWKPTNHLCPILTS